MKALGTGLRVGRKIWLVFLLLVAALAGLAVFFGSGSPAVPAKVAEAVKPALTVSLVGPETFDWPKIVVANGNVVAWQEAVIGPEISNYRITEVAAQVSDRVKKGQVLARIASDTVASELAEAQASVAELQAAAGEAKGNRERAAELKAKGFYSTQLNIQYQTAERTAEARLAAAQARLQAALVKMSKTQVRAPDDGVISARSATVGTLTQTGQELFRLIRGGRLEWRAELPSADLAAVPVGAPASLVSPNGETVKGKVRAVAPSVDPQTRNGLVYVDLPAASALRAGMFARGEVELGRAPALTLPQTAVLRRDGFAYVYRIDSNNRVVQTKVTLGRQQDGRIEILSGLAAKAPVVENGAGFLTDGDLVKVVSPGDKSQ